jgi:pimeloyl-ACP methyl ester carboxylesterase
MPFLSHAGLSLRYDRAGSGPPVLLIHGWMCNRTFWARQVHVLRDRFTVVTVDLRGHGESSRPRTGYTPAQLAADLEHLVRTLGTAKIAVVGWSLGGVVAMELARRLGERASALGLVGTTPGALTDPKNPLAKPETAAAVLEAIDADFRGYVRAFAARCFKDGAASLHATWAATEMQKTPPAVARAAAEGLFAADLRPHLKALRVPAAVLHGRHDDLLPFAGGVYLATHIPGAKLVAFEGSGHTPHLEEPDAFNAALAELLARGR